MKINLTQETEEVFGTEVESRKTGIKLDAAGQQMLQMIMSERLYSKPIPSICREYISNAWDANVENNSTEPVIVSIDYSTYETEYVIRDFGKGLSYDGLADCMDFLSSTKRNSDKFIGGFGLGMKSGFAYTPLFKIVSYYDGKKTIYTARKENYDIKLDLITEEESKEATGLEIRIPIKAADAFLFEEETFSQTAFFPNIYYSFKNSKYNNHKILHLSEELHFCTENLFKEGQMGLLLGNVRYPIPVHLLREINLYNEDPRLAIKFDIGDLTMIPNREEIIWDEINIQKLKDKAAIVSNTLAEYVNNHNKDIDTIVKYMENQGYGNKFQVNYLEDDSNKKSIFIHYNNYSTHLSNPLFKLGYSQYSTLFRSAANHISKKTFGYIRKNGYKTINTLKLYRLTNNIEDTFDAYNRYAKNNNHIIFYNNWNVRKAHFFISDKQVSYRDNVIFINSNFDNISLSDIKKIMLHVNDYNYVQQLSNKDRKKVVADYIEYFKYSASIIRQNARPEIIDDIVLPKVVRDKTLSTAERKKKEISDYVMVEYTEDKYFKNKSTLGTLFPILDKASKIIVVLEKGELLSINNKHRINKVSNFFDNVMFVEVCKKAKNYLVENYKVYTMEKFNKCIPRFFRRVDNIIIGVDISEKLKIPYIMNYGLVKVNQLTKYKYENLNNDDAIETYKKINPKIQVTKKKVDVEAELKPLFNLIEKLNTCQNEYSHYENGLPHFNLVWSNIEFFSKAKEFITPARDYLDYIDCDIKLCDIDDDVIQKRDLMLDIKNVTNSDKVNIMEMINYYETKQKELLLNKQ